MEKMSPEMRLNELASYIAISQYTFKRIDAGKFVPFLKLGPCATRTFRAYVDAWLHSSGHPGSGKYQPIRKPYAES
jgi:predicted DNA-binding transcriptional regulator AlpA